MFACLTNFSIYTSNRVKTDRLMHVLGHFLRKVWGFENCRFRKNLAFVLLLQESNPIGRIPIGGKDASIVYKAALVIFGCWSSSHFSYRLIIWLGPAKGPTSDPVKPVLGLSYCPVVLLSGHVPFLVLFWQRYCEQSARPGMLIGTPSQIAVDCKSVHYLLQSDTAKDIHLEKQVFAFLFSKKLFQFVKNVTSARTHWGKTAETTLLWSNFDNWLSYVIIVGAPLRAELRARCFLSAPSERGNKSTRLMEVAGRHQVSSLSAKRKARWPSPCSLIPDDHHCSLKSHFMWSLSRATCLLDATLIHHVHLSVLGAVIILWMGAVEVINY